LDQSGRSQGAPFSRAAMKLEKWCVISRSSPALEPPELERFCLHGFVSGHARCADGKEVTTSLVVGRNGINVVTKSGSEYELGIVDPVYESLYPKAKRRLLARLQSVAPLLASGYEI
jgi:hypothetical protein